MEKIEHIVRKPEKRTRQTPLFFQHGAWHGAWCWSRFLDYFTSLGYEAHAISLPGHGASSMHKGHINRYSFRTYVDCMTAEIARVSPTPVVIGHSMGGAIIQKYLETHRPPGAVLLASIPASGIAGMLVRWFRRHPRSMLQAVLTLRFYALVETPELARQALLGAGTTVDMASFHRHLGDESFLAGIPQILPTTLQSRKVRTPVLVLAGDEDSLFTVAEERRTARALHAEFDLFPGQAHNLMMEPAWQQVADRIDGWVTGKLGLD